MLSNILLLILGAFDDEDVIHVDGDVNPIRDLETIGEELRLKDEEQLMQNIEKLDRTVNRGGDKKLKPEYVNIFSFQKRDALHFMCFKV